MERSTLAKIRLRAHQREAVDAVLRALELPPGARIPARGLRTQVITATGSGKAYVAARSADELEADRVLILVPSLDLLTQTRAGLAGQRPHRPRHRVSSLRGEEASFPNTTDSGELVEWARNRDQVTVFGDLRLPRPRHPARRPGRLGPHDRRTADEECTDQRHKHDHSSRPHLHLAGAKRVRLLLTER
ncbi:DEAD/DEAH box helicase family protein [Streptomyces sp. NBC_01185]|uniref:DEAD/DEAH box helicase family protein n=1 Tax=Streptomyces sp. NBC_01185 TaxID=2903764 RepID=UPI003866F503|nr:DEAD/DEAH box helicase family protein [Streptomyces sp. NBC_01185]